MMSPPAKRPMRWDGDSVSGTVMPTRTSRSPVSGAKKAMTMATPPRRGMGREWTLRSLGWS